MDSPFPLSSSLEDSDSTATATVVVHRLVHPQHPLKLIYSNLKFTCHLCRNHGTGSRYRCKECDFTLHKSCATLPETHPIFLHPDHHLHLQRTHRLSWHRCRLCHRRIKRSSWAYKCIPCGSFFLHPGCTQYPEVLARTPQVHPPHDMQLVPPTNVQGSGKCDVCRGKCRGWRYKCEECGVHVHVECSSGVARKKNQQLIKSAKKLCYTSRTAEVTWC